MPEPLRRTGVVYDERCLAHRNPPGGVAVGSLPSWATVEPFERPERLSLSWSVLEGSGVLRHVARLEAREATEEELALVHTPAHVRRVLDAAGAREPVCLGPDAWTGPGTRAAALLAFTFSFDDVVISNFTAGAGNDTWPLRILSGIRFGLRPDLNAAATMMLGVTLLGLGGAALILRRAARTQGHNGGVSLTGGV